MTKTCKICNIDKPFSDFTPLHTMRDGYRNECKSCRAERQREWLKEPENHAKQVKSNSSWRNRNRKHITDYAKDYYTALRLDRDRIDTITANLSISREELDHLIENGNIFTIYQETIAQQRSDFQAELNRLHGWLRAYGINDPGALDGTTPPPPTRGEDQCEN